jgi:hypothetical protein
MIYTELASLYNKATPSSKQTSSLRERWASPPTKEMDLFQKLLQAEALQTGSDV